MNVDTEDIKKLLDDPDTFIGVSKTDAVDLLRSFIKQLYDLRMLSKTRETTSHLLPELYIDNFDNEQVFQQLEIFNNHAVEEHRRAIKAIRARSHGAVAKVKNVSLSSQLSKHVMDNSESKKKQVRFESDNMQDLAADTDGDNDDEDLEAENNVDNDEDDVLQKLLDSMSEKKPAVQNDDSDDADDNDSDGQDDDSEAELNSGTDNNSDTDDDKTASSSQHRSILKQKTDQVSAVDDRFFKLAEMEAFLDEQDLKEQRRHSGNAKDTEDDDDDEDYDLAADDKVETAYMYSDFFDAPDDIAADDGRKDKHTDDIDESMDIGSNEENTGVSYEEHGDKDKADDTSDDDSADADDSNQPPPLKRAKHKLFDEDSVGGSLQGAGSGEQLSSFEKRQEKLRHKIHELEDGNLREKSWQLSGEVLASARPENSLLAETLDFEYMTRQAPVITETTTKTLEDLIIQRIKDKAWDDVERKAQLTDKMLAYRKATVLDQEKSKLSLSQIYEQQFLKQTQKGTPEEEKEDPKHAEIKTMMQSLFVKLDALANFHFTPKPVIPEVKVVSNLPALSMEETIPSAVSDATLLAPQEVETKQKRELVGKTERTATDKLRERRLKKRQQKMQRLQKEKREKMKAEKTARLGSMKNLMDTITASKVEGKSKKKTRQSKEKKEKKKQK